MLLRTSQPDNPDPLKNADESCPVPAGDSLFKRYHDVEWGVPVDDDNRIFEKLCLEGFQSGLSWRTILHRREAFREAFANFDLQQVAGFSQIDINKLCSNKAIVRNRRKIESVINNAHCSISLQKEVGSLAAFFWQFEPPAAQRPKQVTLEWLRCNPYTVASTRLSKALKTRGFSFVGPTNMYALMQALGLVNDHVHSCPRSSEITRLRRLFSRPA